MAGLRARFPGAIEEAPPPFVEAAIDLVQRLLAGQQVDLAAIPVDLGGLGQLDRKVLEHTRAIPQGETRTYGEVAKAIGSPGAAQAVGAALGRNPVPIVIPCHRILAAGGKSGGFSAPGGAMTKLKILEIERARRPGETSLFDDLPLALKPRA